MNLEEDWLLLDLCVLKIKYFIMKFCQLIKKEKVFKMAMSLISKAKDNIFMTMNLEEEMKRPLPKTYHNALAKLAKKEVIITRYGFGSKRLFNNLKKKYKGVVMYYGGSLNKYQRMLIIDKKKGLFALNDNVYFTSFSPLIKSLMCYVKIS